MMQTTYRVWAAWLAVLLAPGVALAQRALSTDTASAAREVLALPASDGRNHEIEAIALAPSRTGHVVYVVERAIDLFGPGATEPGDGEFLLWKLDGNGKVLGQEVIAEVSDLGAPWVTIVPLPAPRQGAIVIGQFDAQVGWSMVRVDGDGKLAGTINLGRASGAYAAVPLPDGSGLLLAGQRGFLGYVRKVDLDGKVIWEKTYTFKAKTNGAQVAAKDDSQPTETRTAAVFYSIALTDEPGGFVVAGDHGVINKFGLGQKSVWLLRCNAAGKVVSESSFPGRLPDICPVGAGQFAVLYDVGAEIEFDGRLRRVDQQLEQQLETKVPFVAFYIDRPAIAPVPSSGGFVLAGNNAVINEQQGTARRECRIDQYNFKAVVVSSVSIPVAMNVILHTRVASGANRVYAAFQTKGLGFDVGKEAAVYAIRLVK